MNVSNYLGTEMPFEFQKLRKVRDFILLAEF